MSRFVAPEKLVFEFYEEPQLIPWDFEQLVKRYYYLDTHERFKTEANVRKHWNRENAAIERRHIQKLHQIYRVVDKSILAGCEIKYETHQATRTEWKCLEKPVIVNVGPPMKRITITKGAE